MASALVGSKRLSMATPRVEKKRRTDCDEIAKAVKRAKDLPSEVTHLLASAVPHALYVYSDQRHDYQAKVVDMVETALRSVEAELKQAHADAAAKIASKDNLKLDRIKSVTDQANNVAEKKGIAARQEADVVIHEVTLLAAKEDLAECHKAAKGPERDYEHSKSKADELQAIVESRIQPLKEVAGTNKAIQELVKEMRKFEVDESLLSTLFSVVAKAPAERSDFDQLAFNNLEKAVSAKATELAAGMQAAEPQKTRAAAAVDAAKAKFDAASDALKNGKAALVAAQKEVSEAESDLNKVNKASDHFEDFVKTAEANANTTRKTLLAFQTGPLETFASLKTTASPQPPAPDAEEGAAAAA
jgi:chromosome segregation ATPase